ncbi:MAG: CCA tRNA nucleotidyltransferase [Bdellovibrionales bacterium]
MQASFEQHPNWPRVSAVIRKIAQAGHEVVLAGGCVRDAWLKKNFHDFDVATSATPDQVQALFEKTVAVGKAFGVIMVVQDGLAIEVATFRRDGGYQDGRHPTDVHFSSLREDALRRDFTINALYYRVKEKKIVDLVGGVEDLQKRRICAVGDPQKRFAEDRLRILRAVRFAAQLDFEIESSTWRAVVQMNSGVSQVARERQIEELRKLCQGQAFSKGWTLLEQSHLLKRLLPRLAELVEEKTSEWFKAVSELCHFEVPPPFHLQLAWMFYALNEGEAERFVLADLKNLKATLQETTQAQHFILGLFRLLDPDLRMAKRLRLLDTALGPWFLEFWPRAKPKQLPILGDTLALFRRLMDKQGRLPQALIRGTDLLELGFKPGAELGRVLNESYSLQLERGWGRPQLLQWLKGLPSRS